MKATKLPSLLLILAAVGCAPLVAGEPDGGADTEASVTADSGAEPTDARTSTMDAARDARPETDGASDGGSMTDGRADAEVADSGAEDAEIADSGSTVDSGPTDDGAAEGGAGYPYTGADIIATCSFSGVGMLRVIDYLGDGTCRCRSVTLSCTGVCPTPAGSGPPVALPMEQAFYATPPSLVSTAAGSGNRTSQIHVFRRSVLHVRPTGIAQPGAFPPRTETRDLAAPAGLIGKYSACIPGTP